MKVIKLTWDELRELEALIQALRSIHVDYDGLLERYSTRSQVSWTISDIKFKLQGKQKELKNG